MLKKLLKYFYEFFKKGKKIRYKTEIDVPKKLKRRTIYLIANDGYVWQAIILCPCGCDVKLFINLIEEQKPYWNYSIDENKNISIHPSIHRKVECKSHFFIRKGKVLWV
jgi:Family of unknown function (DUF6527)